MSGILSAQLMRARAHTHMHNISCIGEFYFTGTVQLLKYYRVNYCLLLYKFMSHPDYISDKISQKKFRST